MSPRFDLDYHIPLKCNSLRMNAKPIGDLLDPDHALSHFQYESHGFIVIIVQCVPRLTQQGNRCLDSRPLVAVSERME